MFIYRPELLMMTETGAPATRGQMLIPVSIAIFGVTCFAAGIAGQLRNPLGLGLRVAIFSAAALLLAPGPSVALAGLEWPVFDLVGIVLFGIVFVANRSSK
ncbi:MAG: hypothetical protein Ct9H300mP25_02600 [Acidobacteriota bacterium]|nr:MAG: hypothetical protein Ct9H300mP25_02600 [Acidobacteriota bacterium]